MGASLKHRSPTWKDVDVATQAHPETLRKVLAYASPKTLKEAFDKSLERDALLAETGDGAQMRNEELPALTRALKEGIRRGVPERNLRGIARAMLSRPFNTFYFSTGSFNYGYTPELFQHELSRIVQMPQFKNLQERTRQEILRLASKT